MCNREQIQMTGLNLLTISYTRKEKKGHICYKKKKFFPFFLLASFNCFIDTALARSQKHPPEHHTCDDWRLQGARQNHTAGQGQAVWPGVQSPYCQRICSGCHYQVGIILVHSQMKAK